MHRTDRDRTTGAVCGLGPELEVDGRTYPTAVTGTIGAVLDGTPLTVTGCGAPVRLSAGNHQVRVIATDQYTATRLTLQPSTAGSSAVTSTEAVTQRDVGVRSWTTSRRVLDVASGPEALLVLPENANDGWRATLGGRELTPLRVDGWMQGYLLPAGDGGRVTHRVHAEPSLPGRARGSEACWLSCSWRRRSSWGDARSVPLRCMAPDPLSTIDTAGRRPWAWRWRLPALLAGALLGGPAFAAGLSSATWGGAGSVIREQSARCSSVSRRWPPAWWRASRRTAPACRRPGATCWRPWGSDSWPRWS